VTHRIRIKVVVNHSITTVGKIIGGFFLGFYYITDSVFRFDNFSMILIEMGCVENKWSKVLERID
jgi:ABC-type proline/glycine betaine transport system permease subunit